MYRKPCAQSKKGQAEVAEQHDGCQRIADETRRPSRPGPSTQPSGTANAPSHRSRSTCGDPPETRPRVAGGLPRKSASRRLTRRFRQDRCLARLGPGVRREALHAAAHPAVGCGSLPVCSPSGTVTRRGSKGDCPARSSTAHLAVPIGHEARQENAMAKVIIGVDPHKLSATIEVVDRHEKLLGSGRFGTDQAGYAAMRTYVEDLAGAGLGGRGQQRRRPSAGAAAARGRRARRRRAGQARRPGPALRHRPQPQDRRPRRALDRGRRGPHHDAAGAAPRR